MKTNFSQNLLKLRKEKGLSQNQLAQLSGLTKRIIAHYESGLNNSIINNFEAIAKALHTKVSDLFQESSISTPSDSVQIDSRSMEKIKKILELPRNERHMIYTIAEAFANRNNKSTSE